MKILLSSVAFLFIITGISGQIGIQGQYHIQHPPVFYTDATHQNENNINLQGIGIDYTFRLKEYRVEFFPTFVYLKGSTTYRSEFNQSDKDISLSTYGLQLNTHFYIFDIEGDCHCPTWSKDGTFLKKGFYFSVALNVYGTNFKSTDYSSNPIYYGAIAAGAGVDIGITKNITLTPSFQYELQNRKVITPFISSSSPKNETVSNLIFGLRLGYSFKDN